MRHIENDHDFAEMFASDAAVLFILVDWSDYARRGAEVIKFVEGRFAERVPPQSVSWWTADMSSIESPLRIPIAPVAPQ